MLSLEDVYVLARQRNAMLQAVQATVEATRAQESSARLPPDPQLQFGVMNAELPGLGSGMPTFMAPALQAMQMFPFPGKLALSGRIARQSTVMADAMATEAWWEIRGRAAMAFYEIYSIDRQLDVMRETLQWLEDFGQVAKAMYAAGEGRQADVLRAGVEVARMDAEIARMQAMRTAAAARLNAVLNRPADAEVPWPALPDLPLVLPDAETLEEWAAESRPLLERARVGLAQAQTRRSLARKEIWPDFNVGVAYGQRPGDMGTERMGSLMLGFAVPIFAGRRQLEMRRETEAMEQMYRAELADLQVEVGARIGELVAELERARTLVELYRTEVLPQADAGVLSAFSSYRVGAVDFMTLVDAQMTVNRYRQDLYVLLAEYGQIFADLEMTIGRALPSTGAYLAEDE
jgi:outer membrane protein TolC